jgi:hypothetical protein
MNDTPKKYPCPDCKMCQYCADTRCEKCLGHALKERYDQMKKELAEKEEEAKRAK